MLERLNRNCPVPSIQRLPSYLRFLKSAQKRGDEVISCTRIAENFGQFHVQVRKDLAITGVTGRPKIGYNVDELITAIEHFLGWDKMLPAYLVGVGGVGSAVLRYQGFYEHGLRIVAAFDNDPIKVALTTFQCPILPADTLVEYARENGKVDVGILAVPAKEAQNVADSLIAVGVSAIWNYTPRTLDVPRRIICEDVKLSASFAVLSYRLLSRVEGNE